MRIVKDNSLTLVMLALFVLFFTGQTLTGWRVENRDRAAHGQAEIEWTAYVKSGHFWEASAENWESEFLQMAGFVIFSAFLIQRGSAESKKPEDESDDAQKPLPAGGPVPWPVRKGGLYLTVYSHSLSLALGSLFVASFIIHALGGHAEENDVLAEHGEAPIGFWQFLGSSAFWFQSFQNWQSEFLSIGVLVVLTIFLRERGSPQSKPVEAPNRVTGPE